MDLSLYFNYALRLWKFDETAAQELRENETPSIWNSLLVIVVFGLILGIITTVEQLLIFGFSGPVEIIGFLLGAILGGTIIWILFYLFISLWSQIWINIYEGDRKFLKTLQVFLCIYIPSFIFIIILTSAELLLRIITSSESLLLIFEIIIMLISITIGIYVTFVIVKTFSVTHNLGIRNAFVAGLISTFTITILFFIIGIIIGFIIVFMIGFDSLLV